LKDIYATVLGEFVELPNNNPDYSRYDDIVWFNLIKAWGKLNWVFFSQYDIN
jgi:hypothetical protein